MSKKVKQLVLPLITAVIWGTAFTAQKSGSGVIGAFTFNWTRYLLAALALACFIAIRNKRAPKAAPQNKPANRRALLCGGFVMGTLLMISSNLQQYGIGMTTAGKAGFITALYIVLVPLFGLFLHKRVRLPVWIGVAVAVVGLYLLSFASDGKPTFTTGDLYVLPCALGFTFHILAIDHYTKRADSVELACVQFAVAALESLIAGLIFEGVSWQAIRDCAVPILYAGLISGGVGYTLQVVAQKDGDPAIVSLLVSLEAVFAVLSGALILGERLMPREYLGCLLMLLAVVLVQLPERKRPPAGQR